MIINIVTLSDTKETKHVSAQHFTTRVESTAPEVFHRDRHKELVLGGRCMSMSLNMPHVLQVIKTWPTQEALNEYQGSDEFLSVLALMKLQGIERKSEVVTV